MAGVLIPQEYAEEMDREFGPRQQCTSCRNDVWWDHGMWRSNESAAQCPQETVYIGLHKVDLPPIHDPEGLRVWLAS